MDVPRRRGVLTTAAPSSAPAPSRRALKSVAVDSSDKENRALNTPTKRPLERIYETGLDENGSVTKRSYLKGRFLGKGGFASCYEVACEQTSARFACKVVTKRSLAKPKARAKFKSEIQIHQMLRHPRIVQFERYFEDAENSYLLLELCRNQSLADLLRRRKRLTEAEVRYFIAQLVDGLAYLHKQLVIHRDLKLGNLFLTANMQLKIGDFGLAALLENETDRKTTLCGTPNYIAPEILTGRASTGHSFEVDVWSMGVVMYTLLVGTPPFETDDVKETYKRIRSGEYTFPPHVELSEGAKSVIRSILRVEPHLRPSLPAILAHPFFAERPILTSLPKTSLLHTPPECKRAIASNKRAMDHDQPVRQSLRRRDPVSTKSASSTKPAASTITTTTTATATATAASLSPEKDGESTLVLPNSTNSSTDKSQTTKPAKRAAGIDHSRATTATSDTPAPTVATAEEEDEEPKLAKKESKDPFVPVQETLTRFFFLEEHVNEETLDVFSSASVIVAAAKRVKEIRLEQEAARSQALAPATLWLTQWVDYTSKYGMGYVLSDGSSGVYFNDSTKMVASSDSKTLEYIERVPELSAEPEPFVQYPLDNYDPSVKKKVTLLTHFKSYLIDERERKPDIEAFEKETRRLAAKTEAAKADRMVYVKKWLKTKHAVLFFLSNHTFQFNFYDASKLSLSADGRVATYVDRDGKLHVHSTAATILNRDPGDLMKRLRYARDMFEQIVRINAAAPAEGEEEQA